MTLQHHHPRHLRRAFGFTIIEIMIVVVIIGLLVAMGTPVWMRARRNSQNNAFINDLRVGIYAAQTCMLETGSWPATAGPGVIPATLQPYVNGAIWSNRTPVGGLWTWNLNASSPIAVLKVSGYSVDDLQMEEIDAKIDDGNPATGRFQGASGNYSYIIE